MQAKTPIILNGHEVVITNVQEALGLGGPYIGVLCIDNKFFFKDVLVDFVYSEVEDRLFFAKMFTEKGLLIDSYYFNILIFDLKLHTTHTLSYKYKSIYLDNYDRLLHANLAFHSSGPAITLNVAELMQPNIV
jgi:hypothetical protein